MDAETQTRWDSLIDIPLKANTKEKKRKWTEKKKNEKTLVLLKKKKTSRFTFERTQDS